MASTVHCSIVSAEQEIFNGLVEMVVASGTIGELGIFPGHTPLISGVKPGPVRLRLEGGDEEVFKKAEPVIDCYSKKVKLIGPCGSGQLTKMMNQMCIAGTVQGLSEAINFGINAGLDMDKVMETISKGAAQSWQMENRYRTMTDDKFDYGFAIDWMRKDLKIAIEEAKKNGSPVPITEIIDGYYAEVQEMGGNRWDSSGLIARLKKKK